MAAMPSPSSDEILEIGSVIDGRYRLEGVLGDGGMAQVYRAEHLGLGRTVAVKVLHANLTRSPEAVTRFQREAITSGRLAHPNIVTITDSGVLPDGRCFLVMEALDGETLADRLQRDGRLPWREAVMLARGIVLGLGHAHDCGVTHRDIKPENIFILRRDQEPLVKILDFGIAKLHAGSSDESRVTQRGLTIGTPAYMSPEQATNGEITPASDLYSTAVVLFEMLTGRTPFAGTDPVATMTAHVTARPPTLREVAPEIDLPEGLEEIIQRGLRKIAAERVASAGKLLRLLDDVRAAAAGSHLRGARSTTAPPPEPAPALPPAGAAAASNPRVGPIEGKPPAIRQAAARTELVRTRSRRSRLVIAGAAVAAILALLLVYQTARSRSPGADDAPAALPAAAPALEPAGDPPADLAAPAESHDDPSTVPPDDGEAELAMAPEEMRPRDGDPPTRHQGARGSHPSPADKSDARRQAKQWIESGKAALAAGRFDEATTSFTRALAADRAAHAALAGLAEVAYNQADFQRAVLSARRAIARAPRNASYRMTLAKAYYKIMRYDDAIRQWGKVLELDPSNATAEKNIELARSKLGR
jgi:tetratricopeptide (TPR) repeat protein